MSESYELTYGEVLKELRDYHGYKQKDISDYLNITSQAYSNYEKGKRTPDLETMRKIAQFYRITIDQLISYHFSLFCSHWNGNSISADTAVKRTGGHIITGVLQLPGKTITD